MQCTDNSSKTNQTSNIINTFQTGSFGQQKRQNKKRISRLNARSCPFNFSQENQKEVVLPFHSSTSQYLLNTRNCMLFPAQTTAKTLRKPNQGMHLNLTSRRYHSSHESGRASLPRNLLTIKETMSIHHNRKGGSTTCNISQPSSKIPKLKKNWNSANTNQNSLQKKRSQDKTKLIFQECFRKKDINTIRQGCIAIKMQCIPFQIWKNSSRKKFHHGKDVQRQQPQLPRGSMRRSHQSNSDLRKRIQLLSREENLRKRLLLDLYGNGDGYQINRPFISYFPHTDYDLALKAYLCKQEQKGEKNRHHSVSQKKEELFSSEPILFRRESCLAFTEFNRQRYDINMTRAQLIQKIISCNASEQINGNLLRQIKSKVNTLITTLYPKVSQRIGNVLPINENSDESDDSQTLLKPQQLKTAKMPKNQSYDIRISRIMPLQIGQCESQHQILAQLIQGIKTKPSNQMSIIKSPGKDRATSSNSLQESKISKCQVRAVKHNNKEEKISRFKLAFLAKESVNSMMKQQSHPKEHLKKREFANSIEIDSKPLHQKDEEQPASRMISSGRKQAYQKQNQLKKVNRQMLSQKAMVNNVIQQQKMIKLMAQHKSSREIKPYIITNGFKQKKQQTNVDKIKEEAADTIVNQCDILHLEENIAEEAKFQLNHKIDCSEIIAKLQIASKLLNNAAPGLFEGVLKRNVFFVNGNWIELISKPGQTEKENYAQGVAQMSKSRLKIEAGSITLQHVLKFLTGQRVIVFKHKSTLEKEVLYHYSKGHSIYLLHKRNSKIFKLHGVHNQQDHLEHPKSQFEIKSIEPQSESIFCSFETILESCQVISVNHRISCEKQYRESVDFQLTEAQSPTITLSAPEATSGTITVYFPSQNGALYVEVIMEKLMRQRNGVKSIGRVYQRIKYDNIYFQFTIKGEYRLRIRLEEQVNTQCKIVFEGNNPIVFNFKDRE